MSVKPTQDRILVEVEEKQTTTAGGIVIPSIADDETTESGTVVDAGEGKITKSGAVVPLSVQIGDKIMFNKGTGDKVVLDGKTLLILSEDDILAVLDE
jgi:chaperonin GroES